MSASKSVFTEIAQEQAWGGGDETISGPGSTLRETVMLRAALPGVLAELGIRKLVDAPCGNGSGSVIVRREPLYRSTVVRLGA